ncbi:hypothetical protein BXZ70DRAFT_909950 [Cristinia sonorae]|uniref:CxC2-like cysteine cluster KDZ transposase-associated domain-containing protein n=1 Tax=Cristinia sonorae TaxID=1940300 RepID=A0A8K0UGD4_9AGAR|nr:hypothetical protein BXZ70DRAFT_909950 [Cristinia sonorae]
MSSFNLTARPRGRRVRQSTLPSETQHPLPVLDDNDEDEGCHAEEQPDLPDDLTGMDAMEGEEEAEAEAEEAEGIGEEEGADSGKGKSEKNKDRLLRWLPLRGQFLDEIIRFDGQRKSLNQETCITCKVADADYRCRDCSTDFRRCANCLVGEHKHLLLHRIEVFTGVYFAKASLRDLGLWLQLGHGGGPCPMASPCNNRLLTVVDVSGIHEVTVNYCQCIDALGQSQDHWMQLLRTGWYPATTERPQTAFTFQALDLYLELNWQAKTNLHDFYKTLERLTDKTGVTSEYYRYRQMGLAVRQWRHLHALKRAGRAHDPLGVANTSPGELALECAACPHPGRNIPQGWEQSPPEKLWLYFLSLMVDANFRLRCKDRGLDDVELGSGWAFFVEENAYLHHVAEFADQGEEPVTCGAEHKAIIKANLRKEGYVASGVGAVMCARHALARPCGMGDLQKGEKYCNMDYLILSTLAGLTWLYILISYDIACQFSVNFFKRMETYPENLHREFDELRWAIPKKHISVHGRDHSRFSLSFLQWVARTYGEGIESSWHFNNPLSGATSEMATGLRHEVHDDNWNAWNWLKTISFGTHFLKLLELAQEQAAKHRAAFEDHNDMYDPDDTARWHADLKRWYKNPNSKPDPFEEPTTGISMKQVQEELAKEDAESLARGELPPHEISANEFVQVGLELEEQQRVLRKEVKDKTREGLSLQQKRNTLLRRIMAWRLIQDVYTPGAAPFRKSDVVAEEANLLFPSELSAASLVGEIANQVLALETKLRRAQMEDSLANLRHWRRTMEKVKEFKNLNVRGTGNKANTRIRGAYSRFNVKALLAVERYRAARSALLALDPDGDWQGRFKILRDSDNKGPGRNNSDDEGVPRNRYQKRQGNGYYIPSWIWMAGSETVDEDSEVYSASMRVEWSKMLARAERWEEEELLLEEEMRRTVAFLSWKATWWYTRAGKRVNGISIDLLSGLNAYAQKQGDIWNKLAINCVEKWYSVVNDEKIRSGWKSRYPDYCKKRKSHKGKEEEKEVEEEEEEDNMDVD